MKFVNVFLAFLRKLPSHLHIRSLPENFALIFVFLYGIGSFRPDSRSHRVVSFVKLENYIIKSYSLCYAMLCYVMLCYVRLDAPERTGIGATWPWANGIRGETIWKLLYIYLLTSVKNSFIAPCGKDYTLPRTYVFPLRLSLANHSWFSLSNAYLYVLSRTLSTYIDATNDFMFLYMSIYIGKKYNG